jgi:hypothetical protein
MRPNGDDCVPLPEAPAATNHSRPCAGEHIPDARKRNAVIPMVSFKLIPPEEEFLPISSSETGFVWLADIVTIDN